MKYSNNTDKNLDASFLKKLINLCKDDNNFAFAYEHIMEGRIEEWLSKIGANQLCDIVNQEKYKLRYQRKTPREIVNGICDKLSEQLEEFNHRKMFNPPDIDQIIQITLKEYETLKSEILQNVQNRSQLILLGLAAIFTLIGLGLAPLSDFFTEKEIFLTLTEPVTEPVTEQELTKIIVNKIDINGSINSNDYNLSVTPNIKETNPDEHKTKDFKIIRRTNPETIERKAIVPSVIIFSWLVPIGCQYIIYRVLNWTQSNIKIGSYIAYRIEKRIYDLMILKYNGGSPPLNDNNKSNITHLFWENYMREDERSKDLYASGFVILIFNIIIWCLLIGSWFLLNVDYGNNHKITPPIVEGENHSNMDLIWYLPFIIMCDVFIIGIIVIIGLLFTKVISGLKNNEIFLSFVKFFLETIFNLLLFYLLSTCFNGWRFLVKYKPCEFTILDILLIIIPIFLNNLFLINRISQYIDCLNTQNKVKQDILDNRNDTLGKIWNL